MKENRWIGPIALLVLPAVAFCVLAGYFLVDGVPRLASREAAAVTREYREIAETLAHAPETADWSGVRQKGWKTLKLNESTKWGYAPFGSGMLVWITEKGKSPREGILGRKVARVSSLDYDTFFSIGVPFAMVLFLAVTGVGVLYFVRFVRERDALLAATAHDLTTPLVGMRLTIGRDNEETRRLNERMIRLVSNIKDFLRLGGRRPRPARLRFDLLAAYDEAYALFREDYRDLFEGADILLDQSGLAGQSADVLADETLTVQIIWNLLGNDLKYAAPYGPVVVHCLRQSGQIVLEFADRGKGLSARQMRHVFDRYYRARSARESGKGGFGIGLCTSREFARAMGGDLTVRAHPPSGCIFSLSLPAAPRSL